jgi:hypothetical protein
MFVRKPQHAGFLVLYILYEAVVGRLRQWIRILAAFHPFCRIKLLRFRVDHSHGTDRSGSTTTSILPSGPTVSVGA